MLSLLHIWNKKIAHPFFLCESQMWCWAIHPTSTLATSLSSNLVIVLPIRGPPGQAQTCRKDLCLSNSKFQSQPVSYPRLHFSWQNDWQPADWGAVDFYALKSDSGGIQPITAQGRKDKVQRFDAIAGCTLTSHGACATPEGTAGCREKEQQRLRKHNQIWQVMFLEIERKKAVSRFHLLVLGTKEEAGGGWQACVIVSYFVHLLKARDLA